MTGLGWTIILFVVTVLLALAGVKVARYALALLGAGCALLWFFFGTVPA